MQFRLINLLTLVAVLTTSCSQKSDDHKATTIHNVFVTHPIANGTASSVTFPAVVEEGRTISVGFKTGGQIEKIYVKEGQHISKGQLIAKLDSKDYALGVAALKERFDNMKSETERFTKLHASGNMSDNDYEKAISGFRQLELQLKIEENRLSYCCLNSPASGVVTKVNFENSEMVDAGTPVIELMDNSSLEAIVDLPVKYYSNRNNFIGFIGESSLKPGEKMNLTLLSLTPRADNAQLYRLRLGLPSNAGLTAGMNMKVSILSSDNGDSSVDVPLSSVFENDGKKYVWVVNPTDSLISKTEVITSGSGEGGLVNIVSGLTGNDIIVRAGVRHLTDGERVKIISENSPTNPGNIL